MSKETIKKLPDGQFEITETKTISEKTIVRLDALEAEIKNLEAEKSSIEKKLAQLQAMIKKLKAVK